MICSMIVKDLQPVSIVEDEGFCNLIHFSFIDYKVPCRDTITKRIEKMFESEEKNLILDLEKAAHVAITTDGWTSQQNQKLYVTYTVAYIQLESGKYKNKNLKTNRFGKSHTGINIYEDIDNTMQAFNLMGIILYLYL